MSHFFTEKDFESKARKKRKRKKYKKKKKKKYGRKRVENGRNTR